MGGYGRKLLYVLTLAAVSGAVTGCSESTEAGQVLPAGDDTSSPSYVDSEEMETELGSTTDVDAAADVLDTDAEAPADTEAVEDAVAVADVIRPECTTADECKDFNNCTEDACVDGVCQNLSIPGCCISDIQCDDGIDCTTDKCNFATLECSNTPQDNLCCLDDGDCDDFNQCTLDACVNNQCIHPSNSTASGCECVVDILCDDSNACTTDKCVAGVCTYDTNTATAACCSSDSGCDDGNPSTQDVCLAGLCWNGSAFCATAADCPVPSPCLEASCQDGACSWAKTPDCCFTNADCDDGYSLTTDQCIEGTCVFTLGQPIACTDDSNCGGGTSCVTAVCQPKAKFCTVSPTGSPGCCVANTDCPIPPTGCGTGSCDGFSCQVQDAQALIPYWEESFDGPTLTWDVVADTTTAKWQLATAQFISPSFSLYFGSLPEKTIDVGTTEGSVTSPVINPNLTQPVLLVFQRNAAVEAITSVDKFWLEVVDETSGLATEVWNKNYNFGPGLGWKSVLLDLSDAVSGPFRLRFVFDSVDALAGPLNEGVYVDDVQIGVPCN